MGYSLGIGDGVWADFKVLLGSWATIDLETAVPVYIHHGDQDDNAPLESIRALAAKLTNYWLRISPSASHLGLANDKEYTGLTDGMLDVQPHSVADVLEELAAQAPDEDEEGEPDTARP